MFEKKILYEKKLLKENLLVKAIFPPTVPEKSERIRIVLHSYNTKNEINQLFELVKSVE